MPTGDLMLGWLRLLFGGRRAEVPEWVAHRIQQGHLPVIQPPRRFSARADEKVHFFMRVVAFDESTHRHLGTGRLVITDRRMLFMGRRRIEMPHGATSSMGGDGERSIVVYAGNGETYAFEAAEREDYRIADDVLRQINVRKDDD